MFLKLVREGLGRLIVFGDSVTRPSPVERSSDSQAAVDSAIKSLSLYQFYACPFCVKVRREMARLGLDIELRDAQSGPYREELQREGGQVQAPCLRIEEEGNVQWLYESSDIIAYLQGRFGTA